MDETLSWSTHILEVSGKVAKATYCPNETETSLPPGDSCLSGLDYCSLVYGEILALILGKDLRN